MYRARAHVLYSVPEKRGNVENGSQAHLRECVPVPPFWFCMTLISGPFVFIQEYQNK